MDISQINYLSSNTSRFVFKVVLTSRYDSLELLFTKLSKSIYGTIELTVIVNIFFKCNLCAVWERFIGWYDAVMHRLLEGKCADRCILCARAHAEKTVHWLNAKNRIQVYGTWGGFQVSKWQFHTGSLLVNMKKSVSKQFAIIFPFFKTFYCISFTLTPRLWWCLLSRWQPWPEAPWAGPNGWEERPRDKFGRWRLGHGTTKPRPFSPPGLPTLTLTRPKKSSGLWQSFPSSWTTEFPTSSR